MLGFDLESTGVDPHTALPVSYALVGFEGGDVMRSRSALINPGVPIPPEATAIHHITDEMVADAPTLDDSLAQISAMLLDATKQGVPIVGMNISYDLTIVSRFCLDVLPDPKPVVDLLILDKYVDRYRRGSRTLSALAQHYSVPLGGDAHDASADVIASVQCVRALVAQHPTIARWDLMELHARQKRWHREQKGSLSAYFVKKGGDPIPPWQFEWPVYGAPD
jgi:DNA polymerase-3 subunit epsilon